MSIALWFLRIHPDKAPSDNLRELHTSLFKKAHAAYEKFLENYIGHPGHDDDGEFESPKELPETGESLHYRNVLFRETLRDERDMSRTQAEKKRLARKREAYAREKEEVEQFLKTHDPVSKKQERCNSKVVDDWEQETARLEDEESKVPKSPLTPKRPAHSQPTARTARAEWHKGPDRDDFTAPERRWHKSLLSGGRSGSLSLVQRAQAEKIRVARTLEDLVTIDDGVDEVIGWI